MHPGGAVRAGASGDAIVLVQNAAQLRRNLVAAGVADGPTAVGLVVKDPKRRQRNEEYDERNGDDADGTGADGRKHGLRRLQPAHVLRCAARIDQRNCAVDRAHAVGDKQRLRLRQRARADEHHAVQKAEKRAQPNAENQRRHLPERVNQRHGDDRDERDEPRHRQVDEPANDHERHAQRHEAQRAKLAHDGGQVLAGKELRLHQDRNDHEQHDGNENQVVQ